MQPLHPSLQAGTFMQYLDYSDNAAINQILLSGNGDRLAQMIKQYHAELFNRGLA